MNTSEIDLNDIGGTSISKLKKKNEDIEIDIDYSKILDEINNDTCVNNISYESKENNIRNIQNTNNSKKSKKNINMNSFVRNLETNIENLSKKPVDSIQYNNNNNIVDNYEKTLYEQIVEFKYMDIIFCVLLFMLLNNKLTIETLYRLPYINIETGALPNLLLRSFIFGLVLFIIKKYYL